MDPALRNPLLKLLQWRYGYRDGDFERDPGRGLGWVDGEGEGVWMTKMGGAGGGAERRRKMTMDSDSS